MLVPYGCFQSFGTVGKPATIHRFVERYCECGWATILYEREHTDHQDSFVMITYKR